VWAVGLGVVLGCGKSDGGSGSKPLVSTEPELGWHVGGGERAERAPVSLTASDGTGLTLVSVEARAAIEDPLAFTELHLKFHNPESRRREGRFEIALPPGAAISRFAMRIGDTFQEGEVVERRRAQAVYEDFLHRKQDPALLENDAGNEFAARVFPIEPNEDKEIIISYSQELPRRDTPYQLLLQGLPRLETLDVDVRIGAAAVSGDEPRKKDRATDIRLSLHEKNYVPAADLDVRLPRQRPVALRSGELVVARVVPVLELPSASVGGLTVLFDTSASRALGFGAQIERLGALLEELQKQETSPIDVRVIAFDQTAEVVFRGTVGEFGLRAKARLLARDAMGASDLGEALRFAGDSSVGHPRVLVVGDGVITAGVEDSTRLREAVTRLAAYGVKRLDVLAEGGITDRETLGLLCRAGLAEAGVVLEARSPVSQIASRLRKATRDRIPVNIAGASWVYPDVLEGVQPGDERLVYAELPDDVPVQIELVGAGAEAHDTLEVPRPLLQRAWARAKIESLTRTLRALPADADAARARSEREIVEVSVEHRVVSEYTAMLVLEGPNDYARFGLNQNALTSILRVGKRGLELWGRDEQPALQIARDFDDGPADRMREESPELGRHRGGGEGTGSLAAARASLPVPSARSAEKKDAARSGGGMPREESASLGGGDGAPGAFGERSRSVAPASSSGAAPTPPSAPMPQRADKTAEPRAEASAKGSSGQPMAASADQGFGSMRDPGAGMPSPTGAARQGEAEAPSKAKSANAADEKDALAAGQLDAVEQRSAGAVPPSTLQVAAPDLAPRLDLALRSISNVAASEAQRAVRSSVARARQCFEGSPSQTARERARFEIAISDRGSVTDVYPAGATLSDRSAQNCVMQALRQTRFPKPDGASGSAQIELSWSVQSSVATPLTAAPKPKRTAVKVPVPTIEDAYDGALADVLAMLARGDRGGALARANAAHVEDPADVTGLVALGEALEAQRDFARAARAYGSLIDLFPSRADLRRMAAERLERLPSDGIVLAVDSYRRAAQQRPDQPSGPRALAYALLKQSDRAQAFETLERALERGYDESRFNGVQRILREDLGLVGAAWLRVDPTAEGRVRTSLAAHGAELAKAASTRFVLQWETDANDVDFHIYDGQGGHAYYMRPRLPSGGNLYADITTGYGPECFAISGKARAYPYVMQAHYFARGPMGYGMGRVQVIEHDGAGDVRLADFPFLIMKDKAFVELARLDGPLK
jgi:tetratricopeptide (TPR) repeat protein